MTSADALRARLAARGLDWIVPAWGAPDDVVALSTTRTGGEDLVPFLPSAPVHLRQVHGSNVVAIDAANRASMLSAPPDADAAFTRTRGVAIAVRAADCLPVLLADRQASVVGAAHAGWRGLAAGVLEATVHAMGAVPRDLVAWIGPAIGPRRFEVGRDVFDAFVAAHPDDAAAFAPFREGKWLADLPALARRRLARLGVARVDGGTWCTVEDAARFHSWRRDRGAGRMTTAIALAPHV